MEGPPAGDRYTMVEAETPGKESLRIASESFLVLSIIFNSKQSLFVLSMCKDNCFSPHVSNCTEQSLTSSFLKTWEPHGARA